MKKLSILLIGLLLVTGFAFAQEVTVDGEASLTFGVDLDTNQTGFQNSASSSIELEWLSGDESAGTVAFINLTEWEITFESDDELTVGAPSVEAGFVVAPITITIYSAPSFDYGSSAVGFSFDDAEGDNDPKDVVEVALSANNTGAAVGDTSETGEVQYIEPGETVPTDAVQIGGTDFYFIPEETAGDTEVKGFQGLTVTADLGVASVDVFVASDGTWVENSDNAYAFGTLISADVAPLSVTAGVWAGPTDALDVGFTVGVGATVGPTSVDLGFDGVLPNGGGDMNYDAEVSTSTAVAGITFSTLSYLDSVGGADLDLDQQVVLDASGVVEGLGFTETFQMIDLLTGTDLVWYSLTEVSYAVGGIKPYADFGITSDTVIDLTVGVELSGFVENTVFTFEYDVDDIENSNGKITADATISF